MSRRKKRKAKANAKILAMAAEMKRKADEKKAQEESTSPNSASQNTGTPDAAPQLSTTPPAAAPENDMTKYLIIGGIGVAVLTAAFFLLRKPATATQA